MRIAQRKRRARARRRWWSMCWPNRALWTGRVITRGICAGSGLCPPNQCAGSPDGQAQAAARAHRYQPGSGLPPDGGHDRVRAVAGSACRWPRCDKPAEYSDIDHTVPWPCGPTHRSNNKCYCRTHHLIKTFCGWSDQQLPDGTIILTAPTGLVYRTEPHGAAMFPTLGQPTGELDLPETLEPPTDRSAMMPNASRPATRTARPHQRRTPRTHRTHRRRRTPTPSLARRQLRTATVLRAWHYSSHDPMRRSASSMSLVGPANDNRT